MAVGPVWDHQAAGSNPVTRTTAPKSNCSWGRYSLFIAGNFGKSYPQKFT